MKKKYNKIRLNELVNSEQVLKATVEKMIAKSNMKKKTSNKLSFLQGLSITFLLLVVLVLLVN